MIASVTGTDGYEWDPEELEMIDRHEWPPGSRDWPDPKRKAWVKTSLLREGVCEETAEDDACWVRDLTRDYILLEDASSERSEAIIEEAAGKLETEEPRRFRDMMSFEWKGGLTFILDKIRRDRQERG